MKVNLIGKHEKDSRDSRNAMAYTLKSMMDEDPDICYIDCDLMGCVNTGMLLKSYPERIFQAGIAEANAVGVAAGLTATGKKVYVHSFGPFASRRVYDQVYMSAAYAGLNVNILGSDAGVTAAFNGGTHMPLEDAGMYMSIPQRRGVRRLGLRSAGLHHQSHGQHGGSQLHPLCPQRYYPDLRR